MNIYIWGTGRLASIALGTIIKEERIKGFIDNDTSKNIYRGKRVFHPVDITELDYDAILVINLHSQEIYEQCKKLQLDFNKLIFIHNNFKILDMNTNYDLIQQILGDSCSEKIKKQCTLIRKNSAAEELGKELESGYSEMDYVRIKTFELVSDEIKRRGIKGSVAEVGVFRGEFAQYINAAFPDKKCYLFDSFEGFFEKEAEEEVHKGHATDAVIDAYKNTNIEFVMDKMKFPDKIEIRKGFFPTSLNGLEDEFSFVSIDVDFEKSICECLQYFYPRMVKGGVIFVHDYNSDFKGVKEAVKKYEFELGAMLHAVPLCDANGTLVIVK